MMDNTIHVEQGPGRKRNDSAVSVDNGQSPPQETPVTSGSDGVPGQSQDGAIATGAGSSIASQQQDSTAPFPPVKKMKRGKYNARACLACQQRKIKCDGGQPCSQCASRNRDCVSAPRLSDARKADNALKQSTAFSSSAAAVPPRSAPPATSEDSSVARELLARVAQLERQLSMLTTNPSSASVSPPDQRKRAPVSKPHRRSSMSPEDHPTPDSTILQSVLENEAGGPTFAGEATMSPGFKDALDPQTTSPVTGSLHHRPHHHSSIPTFSRPDPLIPVNDADAPSAGRRKLRGWLEKIFAEHGLVADEAEWRRYLHVFLEEIHVLYPFLHPPALWQAFEEMWEYSALWIMSDTVEREQKQMSVALVCFCLALGRCSVSTRMEDLDGVHSAGWTMYSAGMSLVHHEAGDGGSAPATMLLAFQTSIARIVYLFRLDAAQKAARLMAVLITNAHIAGLHRQKTLDNMPVFRSQMLSRTWWAIYILDRRLALESGRPFLIQDANIDTALPLPVSDEWLNRYIDRPEKMTQMQHDPDLAKELARTPFSLVLYVECLVRFYRVVGKVWPALYGKSNGPSAIVEYADASLSKLMRDAPPGLTYKPDIPWEEQAAGRPRWQMKQALLFFMYCTFLRLLTRRPSIEGQWDKQIEDDELESTTMRAMLAGDMLAAHESVRDTDIKYSFPCVHLLINALMVMIGLLTREPGLRRRYGPLMLSATRSLNLFCYKIWVSGKMMRTVSKLNSLVQAVTQDGDNGEGMGDGVTGPLTQQLPARQDNTTPPQSDGYQHSQHHLHHQPLLDQGSEEQQQQRGSYYAEAAEQVTTTHQHPLSQQHQSGSMAAAATAGRADFPVNALADFDFESMIMTESFADATSVDVDMAEGVEPGGGGGMLFMGPPRPEDLWQSPQQQQQQSSYALSGALVGGHPAGMNPYG